MRLFTFIYLSLGLALFFWLVIESNPQVVADQIIRIGLSGFLLILFVYFMAFVLDTISWQLTFFSVPVDCRWISRLFLIRTIGEAFNTVIPAATMGGEPVKALLLKQRYAINFKESGATLVMSKTINLLALVLFLCIGLLLLIGSDKVPDSLKIVAGAGLAALTTGTILFFLVQRLQLSSWIMSRAGRWSFMGKLATTIDHIREIDEHFVEFYTRRRVNLLSALALSFVNWLTGTCEMYVTMWLIGYPVSISDALIIEAATQLVRAGTFFIPASIGAQEGAFVVSVHLLTGSVDAGLAAALVRRCRELVWVAAGLLMAWKWSVKIETAAEK